MRILLINNHHYPAGGTERYYFELAELLKGHGHVVAFFSMKDKRNKKSKWQKYFVSQIDFETPGISGFLKNIYRMFYSIEAQFKIQNIISQFKPDLVHINNIYFFISPSILGVIKKNNIPIVQTVHDYHLISPNPAMFANGKIDESTKGGKYYKTILSRGIKGSLVGSIEAVVSMYVQEIFKLYKKHVDVFICPSRFMRNKLIEYGYEPQKLIYLPNPIKIPKTKKTELNNYILYFGHININKGADMVLRLARKNPHLKIRIYGNADDRVLWKEAKTLARQNKNLKIYPHSDTQTILNAIKGCRFVVVPSKWYENQPYTVMESYSLSKCVIASRTGGIPEIVINNKTGYLFANGNYGDFEKKVLSLWENKLLAEKMGKEGKKFAVNKFDENKYVNKLVSIYNSGI